MLIKNLFTVLEPIWEKRKDLLEKPDMLEDIIKSGSRKAAEAAAETMKEARKAIGI